VTDGRRTSVPWLLIAASVLFAVLLFYVLFSAYLPTKHRLAKVEAELRALYASEAKLQSQVAQQEKQYALRERQLKALTAERDALARRIDELERELGAPRTPPPAARPRR
jgi:septal ring factor EnvC (AmiA/AmiB activator)